MASRPTVDLRIRPISRATHFINEVDLENINKLWFSLKDRFFRKFRFNKGYKKFSVELEKVKFNNKSCRIIYFYTVKLIVPELVGGA